MENSPSEFNIGGGRKEINKREGWTMESIQYEEQREKKIGRKWANVWTKLSCLTHE